MAAVILTNAVAGNEGERRLSSAGWSRFISKTAHWLGARGIRLPERLK
jgi:hypothetical protein